MFDRDELHRVVENFEITCPKERRKAFFLELQEYDLEDNISHLIDSYDKDDYVIGFDLTEKPNKVIILQQLEARYRE